jgi:hypothetical protein
MTVVVDADVILDEDSELSVEVEGTGFVIAKELLLDGKPDLLSGVVALTNDVLEVDGDGIEEPRENDVVHPSQAGKGECSDVEGDMVVESVVALAVPGGDVEDDGNQGLDVLDTGSLGVEKGDGGGLERVVDVGEGRRRRCNFSRTRRGR